MGASLAVVSPHLDDAVFSCGQIITAHPGALVVTVCAGIPPSSTGRLERRRQVALRRRDDTAALDVLGAHALHLEFLDDPDRPEGDLLDGTAIRDAVGTTLSRLPTGWPELVLVPLGLTHPDHVAVADACRPLATHVYEELPYRVWWPEDVTARLTQLALNRRHPSAPLAAPELDRLDTGPRDQKRAAVERYASELTDDLRAVLYVPERTWRVA